MPALKRLRTSTESFQTTSWTRVRSARADSAEGREALSELCAAYYAPVLAFLRCELRDADAARDAAHAFFAQMLEGGGMQRAEPGRGRFRAYLLGAVRHFLSHEREAAQRLKRGGGVPELLPLDTEATAIRTLRDTRGRTPDAAFDRQWALTLVARAFETVRRQCVAEGRGAFFEKIKPWLSGDAAHGSQTALAAECGLSPAALKMAVQRLKSRFRDAVRAEIAETLDEGGQVTEEMQSLYAALEG